MLPGMNSYLSVMKSQGISDYDYEGDVYIIPAQLLLIRTKP